MALKVVPAGDDRCDIHNRRTPPRYICKTCMDELGVEAAPSESGRRGPVARLWRKIRRLRSRTDWKLQAGAGVALLVVVGLVLMLAAGGDDRGGPPSQEDVVEALDLVQNPDGTGWLTADGACVVVTIVQGDEVRAGPVAGNLATEVTNADGTLGAVVRTNYSSFFSTTQAECANRIQTSLRDDF
jgi:hypothetical protein